MPPETVKEVTSTPSQISIGEIRQFTQSVESGNLGLQLADDCILNIFGRSVKGASAVISYISLELAGRIKHLEFEQVSLCDEAKLMNIKARFEKSMNVLKRKMKSAVKHAKPPIHCRLRAESDDEDDIANCPTQLSTPSRSDTSLQDTETHQYIECCGVVERHSDGADFTKDHIRLVLGFRSGSDLTNIFLIIYEKYVRARTRTDRSILTDDEGEEFVPRLSSVRRALFAKEEDCVEPDKSTGVPVKSTNGISRKRHQTKPVIQMKRKTLLGNIRF